MSLNLQGNLTNMDNLLDRYGLYSIAEYLDVDSNEESYDPISGGYLDEQSEIKTFKCIVTSQNSNNEKDNSQGVSLKIIVLPRYLKFDVQVDQIYIINEESWQVSSFVKSPQDALYTISLRRK